jgi:hypothetical protein
MARKRVYGDQVTDQAVAGIDFNGLGSAEVLRIDAINVDDSYQRSLRHDLVNKIAKDYDIVKAGPILVNERTNDELWCIDGQHRMAGALQAGETEVLAHVVHGLSVSEEAELRLARNDRKSDTTFEKFRSRLVMGDQKAKHMVRIAKDCGTRINTYPDEHHGINAIRAAETLYDAGEGNGAWLVRVLTFLREVWPSERPEDLLGQKQVSVNTLKSVAWFLHMHVGTSQKRRKHFRDRIQHFGIDDIDRKARAHKAIHGGSDWINYYRTLVEVYNQRLGESNRI